MASCAASPDDDLAGDTATLAQGIQCQDAACDGLLPQSSSCILDPALSIVADGQVWSGAVQIGGIALYYSPACHAIWAATAFYQPRSHRTCAVRRAPVNESLPVRSEPRRAWSVQRIAAGASASRHPA